MLLCRVSGGDGMESASCAVEAACCAIVDVVLRGCGRGISESDAGILGREMHTAVFHYEAWYAYGAFAAYGVEGRMRVAYGQELLQVAYMLPDVYQLET